MPFQYTPFLFALALSAAIHQRQPRATHAADIGPRHAKVIQKKLADQIIPRIEAGDSKTER